MRPVETTADSFQQLTLRQAIDIAQLRNQQNAISQYGLAIAEQQRLIARAASWPKASFQTSFLRRDQDLAFQMPASQIAIPMLGNLSVPNQDIKILDKSLQISSLKMELPLYTGGKISSVQMQAQLAESIAQQQLKRTGQMVSREVKRAYSTVQMLQSLEDIASQSVKLLKATQSMTRSLMEAGSTSVNRLDYLKSEMATNYAESVLVDFTGKKKLALTALANVMGLSNDDTLSVQSNQDWAFPPQHTLEKLLQQAKNFNPNLEMLRLSIEINQAKVTEEKSAYLPQIGLIADVSNLQSSFEGGLSNSTNNNSWTIGVVAQLNLFDGGITRHKIQANEASVQQSLSQEKWVAAGIATAIKTQFIELTAETARAQLAEKNALLAHEHSQLSADALEIGATTPEKAIESHIYHALLKAEAIRLKQAQLEKWFEIEYLIGEETEKN